MSDDDERPNCIVCGDQAVATRGLLCGRHYHLITSSLDQILELAALTDDVLQPSTNASGAGSGGSNEVYAPAPLRLQVAALTDPRAADWRDDDDAIPNPALVLESWVRMCLEEFNEDRADTERIEASSTALSGSVAFLRHWRGWLSAQPWVDDLLNDLTALQRALARAIGDSMWPRPIGACPNCGAKLYPTIGLDVVTCRRCKAHWEGVALARLMLIFEQEKAG